MNADQTTHLQRCLDRLRAGDEAARSELLEGAFRRFRCLARQMLQDYPRVRLHEEADDVLHNALLRLRRALFAVVPESVAGFCRLAALMIRRELLDLARHYQRLPTPADDGAPVSGTSDAPPPACERPDSSSEPSRLAAWGEFHRRVEALPENEKDVVDLLWYQELSQPEAAELLGVDVRTVKRRWRQARLKLGAVLTGDLGS